MSEYLTYRLLGWFLPYMLEKLRKNEHKGDNWLSDDPVNLLNRVQEELHEAVAVMSTDGSPETAALECADIANMAMMAADAYRDQYSEADR